MVELRHLNSSETNDNFPSAIFYQHFALKFAGFETAQYDHHPAREQAPGIPIRQQDIFGKKIKSKQKK